MIREPATPVREPRRSAAGEQDLMPRRYGLATQLLSMAAFTLAFVGWLNEVWLKWFDNPWWLNRYTEYAVILVFGLWRITAERNSYTRRRLAILVSAVTVLWWLFPALLHLSEPYLGYPRSQPVFPSLHVPGTLTFFIVLALVFLFGRRVICGYNCPCVGIRETVGFAFRDRTVRSPRAWMLRHSKWFFFAYYIGIMVATRFPPTAASAAFVGGFYLLVALSYFGSFFVAPLVGNRFYCRYLCPYGATFGLLNHAGFYGIRMERDKCNDCRRCEQVCDMGIPVWEQGRGAGRVTAIEDCMGCARCVLSCPADALEIRDVRNLFRPGLKQNASHLLKRGAVPEAPRMEPAPRPPAERVGDWKETSRRPDLAFIQAQAARCLDCGVPGCVGACPLHNRIPEWMAAVADGRLEAAAAISHSTSNLPEICGALCPQQRLCEGACTRSREPGGAVTIGMVERYINEAVLDAGWEPDVSAAPVGHRVAVVGAGPAGLACADQLSRAGCEVTLFDSQPSVGGLLASGVPPFKLDKSVLSRRQRMLEKQGVRLRLGAWVDDAMLAQLREQYQALFVANGASRPRRLSVPGIGAEGVEDALSCLSRINRDPHRRHELAGKRVLVIGGGDSAIDCARSALREGARRVTLVYRRDASAMRASAKERRAALDEGVRLKTGHVPLEVVAERRRVRAMRFRARDGSAVELPCEHVILAIGQLPRPPAGLRALGVALDEQGRIRVDAHGRTSCPGVYAGGDNTLGPDLVVTAVAAGRRAAQGILQDLRDGRGHAPSRNTGVGYAKT